MSNAEIFAEIVEVEGFLDHLNDMYGRALGVTSRFATEPLVRHLLERSEDHLRELRRLLSLVRDADIVEARRTEWQSARQDIDGKIGAWLIQCEQSLGGSRPDDNLGIDARMIALRAMWDAQNPLTPQC